MSKYKPQEKEWSCGSSAVRNCLIHFKLANVTEKTVRNVCKTTKTNGTTDVGVVEGLEYYGLTVKVWESISPQVFQRRVTKALKDGRVLILNSDATLHWIVALEYSNRKVRVVDSSFKAIDGRKSVDQWITMRQLIEMCFCYERERAKKYFYCIEAWLDSEK